MPNDEVGKAVLVAVRGQGDGRSGGGAPGSDTADGDHGDIDEELHLGDWLKMALGAENRGCGERVMVRGLGISDELA